MAETEHRSRVYDGVYAEGLVQGQRLVNDGAKYEGEPSAFDVREAREAFDALRVDGEDATHALGSGLTARQRPRLCRRYCTTAVPCGGNGTRRSVATAPPGERGRCLHAPLQPWWLPWPYGMANHL